MQRVNGLIRLFNPFEDVRNEVINGEFSAQVLIHQLRYIRSALETAERSSLPHAASDLDKGEAK